MGDYISKLKRHAANVFQNETPDQRVQRLLNLKQHNLQIFQNETPEERDKRLSQIRQHRTQVIENETLEERQKKLLKKRKCYKRSRKSKKSQKVSVDKKEWICRSCNEYLKKNKVPPCAITNGMKFPEKPNFSYLNELK